MLVHRGQPLVYPGTIQRGDAVTLPSRAVFRRYRQLAVVASLAFASAVCLALLAVRVRYAENRDYLFLAWNLFLAWLPLLCSLCAYNAYKRRSRLSWLVVAEWSRSNGRTTEDPPNTRLQASANQ